MKNEILKPSNQEYEMKNENSISKILPVLFGVFIMGFCDVVGITSMHVKEVLLGNYGQGIRDFLSNLIPTAFSIQMICTTYRAATYIKFNYNFPLWC